MHGRRRRARSWSAALVMVALAAVLGQSPTPARGSAAAAPGTPTAGTASPGRPNILVIMTDDQNRGDLRWMPQTRRLLRDHGVTFTKALAPDPLCCPDRAELLTGQLGQNNGVRANRGPRGGFDALLDSQNNLAAWLQSAGYRTALVGKYLNGYGSEDGRQEGWSIWNPTIAGQITYDHTTFFANGNPVTQTSNVTPVISGYTVRYIRRFARSGQPFFIWASHVAPHARWFDGRFRPPLPTRGHRDDLRDVPAPSLSKPSFNDVGDPPWPYPDLAGATTSRRHVQFVFRRRIQSLLDIDDAVAAAVAALKKAKQLGNTYVFLVSDNANLLGEHGHIGKDVLYREALEIPLVVRVPGAGGRRVSSLPVTTPDITSTILELTGATAGRLQDGESFAPVLSGGTVPFRDTQLIQTGDTLGDWSFRGVRTSRYSYLYRVSDGASFLYDHRTDPYELHNVASSPEYADVLAELAWRRSRLEDCAGASCNRIFGPLPEPG